MCGCGCATKAENSAAPAVVPEGSQVVRVDDMSCGHCVGTITKAIQARWPSADVRADLGTKLVTVFGAGSGAELGGIIREAGYNPAL